MSLLAFDRVSKCHRLGLREHVILRDVSLELDTGELAVVWGTRRSGRSTLLRIAAGVERPDSGRVCFEGRDLATDGCALMGEGIGYCRRRFAPTDGPVVFDHVMVGLLARGVSRSQAKLRAHRALERTGAADYAGLAPIDLDSAEAMRVAIARALVLYPRLLVVDEPTKGVDLLQRDEILLLLRSFADEGIAVLASTGEGTGLSGAHRPLSLGDGALRGNLAPGLAPVVQLRCTAELQANA